MLLQVQLNNRTAEGKELLSVIRRYEKVSDTVEIVSSTDDELTEEDKAWIKAIDEGMKSGKGDKEKVLTHLGLEL